MATWIDFRCEDRGTSENNAGECWSDSNSGPMGMAGDTNESILQLMAILRAEAKESGWVRKARGWICPECARKAIERMTGNAGGEGA